MFLSLKGCLNDILNPVLIFVFKGTIPTTKEAWTDLEELLFQLEDKDDDQQVRGKIYYLVVFLQLMPFFLVRNGTIQMTVNKDAEEVRSRLFRDFFSL